MRASSLSDLGRLTSYYSTRVARPRNATIPTTSVTVVNTTPPAIAGSIPIWRNRIGMTAPAKAPAMRFTINANPIMAPMLKFSNQMIENVATTRAHNNPFSIPIEISFFINENIKKSYK